MTLPTTTTEVKLLGQKIILKSTEADPEVIRDVVQLVTMKLDAAENRSKGAVPHQIALLALLDLAEEYVKAKRKTQDLKGQLDGKSGKLLDLIESTTQ